ncbi:MAG: 6-bladed beta-propeller [Geobacteraceae bacterium]|nr:6-bladed beta-propeller [Geobacteraceae bacterium]
MATPAPVIAPVWPSPPLEPRIEWVKEIRDYRGAGVDRGFWKRAWDFIAGEEEARIIKPHGVYFDDMQRLFIVDAGGAQLHLMDMRKGRYTLIRHENGNGFLSPVGISGDDGGNVYVTDSGTAVIFRYSLQDDSLTQFTSVKFARPTGIAFNRANRLLYVVDTAAHQVVALDMTGTERIRFGSRGHGPGQFNYPTDICIDGTGQVIVTDALNSRIQIFSSSGKPLTAFGQAGDEIGHFNKPKGVAVDSDGHIYICDALHDAVQIFDPQGQLLLSFGESGQEPGQFWMPSGIHIDANDFIYVADSFNQRIQVFKYLKEVQSEK